MVRPRQVTDAQIDAVARATFLELGPTASVARVAEQLGVSHAALLQRRGSKENLLVRALRPGAPSVLHALRKPPPRATAALRQGALEFMLVELLAFHEQMLPGLFMLRMSGIAPTPPDGEDAPTLSLRQALAGWIVRAAGVTEQRSRIVAEALLSAIEARSFNRYLGGPAFVSFLGGDSWCFVRELVRELVPELAGGDSSPAEPPHTKRSTRSRSKKRASLVAKAPFIGT
jgi:AcrR family transcriptional regulator